MDVSKLENVFYNNFSLITVSDNKVPNFPWKSAQTKKTDWNQFLKQFNYKGGIKRADGVEIPSTDNFGIVTGFEDLETIDVDLKVLSTSKERIEFWDEYYNFLKDNIFDFEEKFVIYKTRNEGFHIIYKSKILEGNQKLAKLKGHKEAIIETRGAFGYIFAYPDNKYSKNGYSKVQYISDEDRDILFTASKMYNHIEQPIKEPKKSDKKYEFGEITPWDDYNQKNDIFSVIGDELSVVGNLSKKYLIKRSGAKSTHSGYVFKDSGFMYLFSTGTTYDAEKLYTPFLAYAKKYHNDDLSEATKKIYQEGYGSRQVKKQFEPVEIMTYNKDDLSFPIDIFPKSIQSYILECKNTLDSSVDYMGCSLLWLISLSIGNSMQIEVKRGWREIATIWCVVVGKAGIGKTPSISNMIFPIEKINNKEISKYIEESKKYEYYENLSKKDKEEFQEIQKPIKKQFIANDITLEALVDLHQESDNSVGVFKDELAGWFKDMNKYKPGSDLEFWLSTWSGKAVNINRITRVGSFVPNPLIPILGGIQPNIFNSFYTDDNKDNGFMDRMLLSYPYLKVEKYNDKEMQEETIQWYSDTMISFFERVKSKVISRDESGKIEPKILKFSKEAKKEWNRIFDEISEIQNSESENEYMKSMLPKQKSYIPRFSLIIHVFNAIGQTDYNLDVVSKDSILKAEKLSKYFIAMAKKVKIDNIEMVNLRGAIKDNKTLSKKEMVLKLSKENPNFNKLQVSEELGVSVQMIYKYLKNE